MTRVIAGTAKGRVLKVPQQGTRPTGAKMREALFSKLESWGMIEGAYVLDLFAGSGALTIEALSRGAHFGEMVDQSRKAVTIIRENLKVTNLKANVRVMGALQFKTTKHFDLVFLDPPYDWPEGDWKKLLQYLQEILTTDGLIVAERSRRSGPPPMPDRLAIEESRTFGDSTLWFIGLEGSTI